MALQVAWSVWAVLTGPGFGVPQPLTTHDHIRNAIGSVIFVVTDIAVSVLQRIPDIIHNATLESVIVLAVAIGAFFANAFVYAAVIAWLIGKWRARRAAVSP